MTPAPKVICGCEKVLVPVAFSLKNVNDEGDFFNGIAADCAEQALLRHALLVQHDHVVVVFGPIDPDLDHTASFAGRPASTPSREETMRRPNGPVLRDRHVIPPVVTPPRHAGEGTIYG